MTDKENANFMDVNEFYDEGYLQEANRMYFHPLGLALAVSYDKNGNKTLGILDFRDEPTGMYFGIENKSKEQQQEMKNKALHIQNKVLEKAQNRINSFDGSVVEPIPNMNNG